MDRILTGALEIAIDAWRPPSWPAAPNRFAHLPTPTPETDDEDDEDDDKDRGSGGGNIDPDDDEGGSNDEDDDEDDTLWAGRPRAARGLPRD
jgi:hypothetical protein